MTSTRIADSKSLGEMKEDLTKREKQRRLGPRQEDEKISLSDLRFSRTLTVQGVYCSKGESTYYDLLDADHAINYLE